MFKMNEMVNVCNATTKGKKNLLCTKWNQKVAKTVLGENKVNKSILISLVKTYCIVTFLYIRADGLLLNS